MLTAYMIDESYRFAGNIWSCDFCDHSVFNNFFRAFSGHGEYTARDGVRLISGATDALYAQAILQATGALEEF